MPRPSKCRRVCLMPPGGTFGPLQREKPVETLVMTVDEYETIRLIDLMGYTQQDCARQMGVARTTIQSTYNRARHKLARMLAEGKDLRISGGDYRLCPHQEECGGKSCRRRCPVRCTACDQCGRTPPGPAEPGSGK